MERRTVPAFASFKPRGSPKFPDSQNGYAEEDQDRSTTIPHRKHHGGSEPKHRFRNHQKSGREHPYRGDEDRDAGDRKRHSRNERDQRPTTAARPVQDEVEESEYFMIDRRGDSKNVEYGGLHRYSIPNHHRTGHGRVLGADENARIDRHASGGKEVVFRFDYGSDGQRAQRLLTKKTSKSDGRGQRLILPRPTSIDDDSDAILALHADFLALRPNLKRRRGSQSSEPGEPDVDYRSVEGKAKPDLRPEDEDLAFDTSSDEAQETIVSEARTQNTELSRAAKADPTNADAWLALVEHQARSTFPDIDTHDLTTVQRRTVADIRLAVLDQAFKHVPKGRTGHDRLLLTYLTEGSRSWEASKLAQQWRDTRKWHSSNPLLWMEYLNYLQTDTKFRYETCKEAYLECLEALQKSSSGGSVESGSITAGSIVYLLLRLTKFTADAGYGELATAIWQSVLEYYFFAPTIMHGQSKLEAFEEFWESDVPRIGEEGAVGWRAVTDSGTRSATRVIARRAIPVWDPSNPFASFARVEGNITDTVPLPAVTTDEDDESEDPFRYVMFSDIKPVLRHLPEKLDTGLLLDAFLCFMGLPSQDASNEVSNQWRSDPFLQTVDPNQHQDNPVKQLHDPFSMFNDAFRAYSSNDGSANFVHRVLASVATALPGNENIGEFLLAFLCRVYPTETTKTAKRLLKSRPRSLRYYNAYALAEAGLAESPARSGKAEQIWIKALELSHCLSENIKDDAILLWHSWTMTDIHRRDDALALRVLVTVPEESAASIEKSATVSSGGLLRARRYFEEGVDRMHLKMKNAHAELYGDCLAWLLYLSDDHNIDTALRSLAGTSARFQTRNSRQALELLHQAKARLLSHHMRARRAFNPTIFREKLMESRRLFPENSCILEQYYEVAKLTRLDDRMRSALGKGNAGSQEPHGLASWLYAISAEIDRCSIDGGSATRDSVRAFFRRALLTPDSHVKHSPLIWTKWFEFECRPLRLSAAKESVQRQEALRRAKQVFLNGLRFLPWRKLWIIRGMAVFAGSGDMGEEELRQVHDVLVDRELRLRVDVDDLANSA